MRASDAIIVPNSAARLRWVALIAAALLTAYGEFELATLVGFTPSLAWLLPIGLDVYAYCAFAIGRRADVLAALTLMISCQALAHLLANGIIPTHWTLVIVVSAVPPVICWRIHNLVGHPVTGAAASSIGGPAESPDVSVAGDAEAPPVDAPAAPRIRRPLAQTRALVAEYLAEEPDLTREQIAARLGITPRRLRMILNTV